MRHLLLFCVAALLIGCTRPSDPIDRLVAHLSGSTTWENGEYASLGLPKTASPEHVIEKTFEMMRVKNVKISGMRHVHISNGSLPDYIAALVETDRGKKIILFGFAGSDWGVRVYDSKTLE